MDIVLVALHGLFCVLVIARLAWPVPRREPGQATPRPRDFKASLALGMHGAGLAIFYAGLVGAVAAGGVNRAPTIAGTAGALATAAGVALATWSFAALRSWRLRPEVDAGHELCTTGPYRLVRHPIYLGIDLIAFGSAVWVPEPWVALGAAVLILGGAFRARTEERFLEDAFGDAYRAYARRVPRMVPWLGKRAGPRADDEERAYYELQARVYPKFAPFYDLVVWPVGPLRRRVARMSGADPSSRILDVATGTGAQALAFAELAAAHVIGVDLSSAMLRTARAKRRRPNLSFLRADATALPFPDRSFDVTSISFALHEMPPSVRERVVGEIARVTRPGGTLVLVDYGLPRAAAFRPLVFGAVKLYERDHYADFIRSDVGALLRRAGIAVRLDRPALLGAARVIIASRSAVMKHLTQ